MNAPVVIYKNETESGIKLGDKVTAIGFTSSHGDFIPERKGLTISRIRYMPGKSIKSYYRLYCLDNKGYYVEGAERFFVKE